MALDFGERRIGVAISDPSGTLAQPLETLSRRGNSDAALKRIAHLVAEYEVERIVVGLPLLLDGTSGSQAERARRFGSEVAQRIGVSVEYLDERLTSTEARRALRASGVPARKQKGRVDPIAAALLLAAFLELESTP